MQIKGDEFIKKVQIQQEREELERKLNELEEVEMSINNDSVIFEKNSNVEQNEHELDNIMLGSSISNEDNKKKYLILGIVLVVLFLLTIIIIRLLTNEAPKEDQFTSNSATSTEMKKLSESDNIEQNFQKIINERVKKDANEPMVPEVQGNTSGTTNGRVEDSGSTKAFENLQKEAENYNPNTSGISDEAIDQTIKKVEKSKSINKEKPSVKQKEEVLPKEDTVVKKVETKRSSIKDLVESPSSSSSTSTATANDTSSSNVSSGYFIQIGALTKKPTEGFINNIRNAKLKYKIYQDTVNGVSYNKVLIGPYSSKAAASENVEDVKQKLNVSSAFVVKF